MGRLMDSPIRFVVTRILPHFSRNGESGDRVAAGGGSRGGGGGEGGGGGVDEGGRNRRRRRRRRRRQWTDKLMDSL